jgi:hypothetical protein
MESQITGPPELHPAGGLPAAWRNRDFSRDIAEDVRNRRSDARRQKERP